MNNGTARPVSDKQPVYDGPAVDDLGRFLIFAAELDAQMQETLRRYEQETEALRQRFEQQLAEQLAQQARQAEQEAASGVRE